MRGVDHALPAAGGLAMDGDDDAAMADLDPSAGGDHLHRLADEPPWHAIGVGVELDHAVALDPSHQLANLPEGRPPIEGPQGARFVTNEAFDRLLGRAAMDMLIGDLAHPPGKMRFQRRPADE